MNRIAPSLLKGSAAAAVALALLPAPAFAQSASVQAASYSLTSAKTEAILGGTPSALAAIMARQQGLPAPAPLAARVAERQHAELCGLRNVGPLNAGVDERPPRRIRQRRAGRRPHAARLPLAQGRPRRRRRRFGGLCCVACTDRGELDRIEAVNRYVNRRVEFVDDSRQYGRADLWTAASDTLRRGRGDCEDYAIAKLQMLRAAGFSDRDLYLVIVKDLVRRADHAVLVVRAGGRMLVLDNGTDVVADADNVRDYRPVLTFSANGAWTHGYRRGAAADDHGRLHRSRR